LYNIDQYLERLTIVIPTYERKLYVKRQIDYWSNYRVKVEILDGSAESLFSGKTYQFGNIRYWHMPVPIEERLGFAGRIVETEYAALLSDDEFYLIDACVSCISFLDNNDDFGTCKGQAIGFEWNRKVIYREVYPDLQGYQVADDQGKNRMLQHMSCYSMATLWSIQRVKVFKATLAAMGSGSSFGTAAAGELQISLISAYLGKVKVLDQLMWLRSFENANIWWKFGNISINKWWKNSSFQGEHQRFIEAIQEGIGSVNTRVPNDLEIEMAVNVYCENTKKISKASAILNAVKRYCPLLIKRMLIRLFRKEKMDDGQGMLMYIDQNGGHSDSISELHEVENIISKFHKQTSF